jgi:hypothetical protein
MASGTEEELPLGDELSSRLEDALSDRIASALTGADAPRPLPPSTRLRMERTLLARRRTPQWIGGAAAALLVAGGVTAALLATGTGTPGPPSQAARAPRTLVPSAGGSGSSAGAAPSQGSAAGVNTPSALAAPAQGTPGGGAVPIVDGIEPRSGPQQGGTWVVVTGSGFEGVSSVRFGEVRALAFTVVSATEVRAESPPQREGTVDVRVIAVGGTSAAVPADRYTYARASS